jgi:alkylglycerol monooxygenase
MWRGVVRIIVVFPSSNLISCLSGHGVHHSSEEYNLSTALRQSGFEKYFSMLFYMPLTLIANHHVFSFMVDVNMTYQFWVHTKSIRRMPAWFEYVFVTPSHHRVHHARNPRMIDRNYSGMFIVWDRLFGTFQEEDEECVYGLIHPIQTFNPLTVQCRHGWYVLTTLLSLQGLGKKLRFLFGSPSKDPITGHKMAFPEVSPEQPKYDPVIAPRAKLWAGVCFAVFLMVPAVSWIMLSSRYLTLGQRAVSAGLLMTEMMLISFATDGRMPTVQIYYCVIAWSVAAAFFLYRISSMAFVVAAFGPLIAFSRHCLAHSAPVKQA